MSFIHHVNTNMGMPISKNPEEQENALEQSQKFYSTTYQ